METILQAARYWCKVTLLDCYVDNTVLVTPAIHSKLNVSQAQSDFTNVMDFMNQAGVPIHEILTPSTGMKLLGWIFNTETMQISCPPERLKWIDDSITAAGKECNLKTLQSAAGVLEFLAQALPFLRAPLGWLHRMAARYDSIRRLMK